MEISRSEFVALLETAKREFAEEVVRLPFKPKTRKILEWEAGKDVLLQLGFCDGFSDGVRWGALRMLQHLGGKVAFDTREEEIKE